MRCGQKNPTTTSQASHGIEWVGSANESLADLRDGGREAMHNWRRGKKRSRQSRMGFQSQGKAPGQAVPLGMCLWDSALRVHRPSIGRSITGSISQKPAWSWGYPARLGPGEPLGTAAGGLSPFSEPLAEL